MPEHAMSHHVMSPLSELATEYRTNANTLHRRCGRARAETWRQAAEAWTALADVAEYVDEATLGDDETAGKMAVALDRLAAGLETP